MILWIQPAQIDQGDSKNKDLGKSYMIQDKVIKILQLIVGVAKYCRQGVNEVSQVQIPYWGHCIWRAWINQRCKSGLDPIDCKSSLQTQVPTVFKG